MSAARYRKGANRERQLCERLRDEGWVAVRTAGSHGCADIVALKRGHAGRLIQLKAGGVPNRPYAGFGPNDRQRLLTEAHKAGANAELCHWPDRGKPKFYPSSLWPIWKES